MKTKARAQQAEQPAAPAPADAAHQLSDAEQADIRRLMGKVQAEKVALADLHLMAAERASNGPSPRSMPASGRSRRLTVSTWRRGGGISTWRR